MLDVQVLKVELHLNDLCLSAASRIEFDSSSQIVCCCYHLCWKHTLHTYVPVPPPPPPPPPLRARCTDKSTHCMGSLWVAGINALSTNVGACNIYQYMQTCVGNTGELS